jgi:hypothetical protein
MARWPRPVHKEQGDHAQAQEYLTKALGIFERLSTLIKPDKVREELAELPNAQIRSYSQCRATYLIWQKSNDLKP